MAVYVAVGVHVNMTSTKKPDSRDRGSEESTHDREAAMPDAEKLERIAEIICRPVDENEHAGHKKRAHDHPYDAQIPK